MLPLVVHQHFNLVNSADAAAGSPANARQNDFPVTPGGPMPPVRGTKKQDYAVLFIVGVEA